MSRKVRRRRGAVLLGLALLSGALAASQVRERIGSAERRVGPLVPVAVAEHDLRAGAGLRPGDLAVRRVPAAFVPGGVLSSPGQAVGERLAAPLASGGYLTAELLGDGGAATAPALGRGERALEVGVSGGRALDHASPGSRVDVVVSTEPRDGEGRSFVALEGVELLTLRQGGQAEAGQGGEDGAARQATATATLKVTLKQAVYLSAAQNFAREVRLLPRPPGDRRRRGRAAVAAGDL